jgi:predicted phosphodiesterase
LEEDVPGYGRIVAVHATAVDDETNLLPSTRDEVVRAHVAGLDAYLILYGHTHVPLDRTVDALRLVNGGSVGLPLDGDPRASYATLDFEGAECAVTLRRVTYDREAVISELVRVGHPGSEWSTQVLRRATAVS